MAENFTEYLIRHGYIRLAADMISKLRLDHTEGAFDVGPLVVVPHELLPVEGEVMKHLFPQPSRCPAVDAFERNVGGGSMAGNHIRVVHAAIALVG